MDASVTPVSIGVFGIAESLLAPLAQYAASNGAVLSRFDCFSEIGFVGRLSSFDLVLLHAEMQPVSAHEISTLAARLLHDLRVLVVQDSLDAAHRIARLLGWPSPGGS